MFKCVFISGLIYFLFLIQVCIANPYDFSEEKQIYTQVEDIELITLNGDFHISNFYEKTPLIVLPIFSRCSGVCYPLLQQLKNTLKTEHPTEKYRILVLSFDPHDSLQQLKQISTAYGLSENENWIFAISPEASNWLASIGFDSKWDSKKQQFDHDALIVGINQHGYIVKKMIGLDRTSDLKEMFKAIHNEFILSYPLPQSNTIFSCFNFNPITGKKSFSWGIAILILPALITVSFIGFCVIFKKR